MWDCFQCIEHLKAPLPFPSFFSCFTNFLFEGLGMMKREYVRSDGLHEGF